MSSRRTPASTVVAVVLTAAVSLLGFRLFLRGPTAACGATGSACCCTAEPGNAPPPSQTGGCGCSVSSSTPVPAAVLASVDGVVAPALVARAAEAGEGPAGPATFAGSRTVPRARSAPTQALLETFRN